MRTIDADALKEAMREHTNYKGYLVCDPEEIIDLAPTIEPEQPRGEWKFYINSGGTYMRKCLRCGHEFNRNSDAENFCSSCGAKMKEGEEK